MDSFTINRGFCKYWHTLNTHLFTAITHKIRRIFYNIAIFISHGHTINIHFRLRQVFIIGSATITKYSFFTILFYKILANLIVISYWHNRSTCIGEPNYFKINFFTLIELAAQSIFKLFTKSVTSIEAAIKTIKYSSASSAYIIIFIYGFTFAAKYTVK